ncbi:hypothetical protein HK102_001718 [Quaeritorhiza haematococci]|nr:hypothetical protein HK102_001718 [Quaeritorhiza haematococci]
MAKFTNTSVVYFLILAALAFFSVLPTTYAAALPQAAQPASQKQYPLTAVELRGWTELVDVARQINDDRCFGEVMYTMEEASVYLADGLSQDFIDFMPWLKQVAGDIEDTKPFIAKFDSVYSNFQALYNEKSTASTNTVSKVDTGAAKPVSSAAAPMVMTSIPRMVPTAIMTVVSVFAVTSYLF